jgi:hypothetical protein
MRFKRIAKSSGIYDYERYLAADATPVWQRKALDSITTRIDPGRQEHK